MSVKELIWDYFPDKDLVSLDCIMQEETKTLEPPYNIRLNLDACIISMFPVISFTAWSQFHFKEKDTG